MSKRIMIMIQIMVGSYDRTENQLISTDAWYVDQCTDTVIVENCKPFHEYTVSFLAYLIWDPTQMYNHITNDWGDKPHEIPFDVRKQASREYVKDYLKQWLKDNPNTDVVRFTTFFYHFTLIFNNLAKEKLLIGAVMAPVFPQKRFWHLKKNMGIV